MKDYGCKNGLPHDLYPYQEDKTVKVELCRICNEKIRFGKEILSFTKKGIIWGDRIDNKDYVEKHSRNFVQPYGKDEQLYRAIYGSPNRPR